VARQSRSLPIDIAVDPSLQPFLDNGRAAFYRRQGQLNLACYQCHDENWGKRLAAIRSRRRTPRATRSTGSNGRASARSAAAARCLTGIRAAPYEYGAPELVELELF